MAKITLDTLLSGFKAITGYNTNNSTIQDEFNNKVLYRDNPAGEPNQMENELDMNTNSILNLPTPGSTLEPVRVVDLDSLAGATIQIGTKSYPTVASMKADTALSVGDLVHTKGYYTAGDGGGATYLVVAPQAFDGYGDHELANGNIAVLQVEEIAVPRQFGVASTSLTKTTAKTIVLAAGRKILLDGDEWDADLSDLSLEVAEDTLEGIYIAPSSDPTGASGAWVRDYVGDVHIEWFVDTSGDFGAAMNSIMDLSRLSSFSDSVSIVAGMGTFSCTTMWDIDKASTNSSISFKGSGISAGSAPNNGTIIDGSSMTTDVINGARTKDNYHIRLESFTMLAPSAFAGMRIGDQSLGHTPSHSFLENIVVHGGDPGIEIEFMFNGWLNKLYSVLADGTGIRLDTMNSTKCGLLTVRQAKGTWAMDIEKGLGVDYGNLYLESNSKSALRTGDDMRASRINNIYTENNNTDNTQAYEILIADQTVAAEDTEAFEIGGLYLSPPANAYTAGQLAVEHGTGLILGPLWGTSDPLFTLVGSNVHHIVFRGWSQPSTESIDLSNCASGSKFTFLGCNLNPTSFTYPPAQSDVEFVGCDRLMHDEETIYVSAIHDVKPWERNIAVDTAAGALTITLPPTLSVSGKFFSVSNTGAATNDVTVDTNGAETIQGAASTPVTDGKTKMFIWNKDKAQWMICAST